MTKVTFHGGTVVVPRAADGPIPEMIATELSLARSGALDTDLISDRAFYGSDFTKPLLFLEDGQYFSNLATADHLTGTQWGVMNETGSYPGQPWLWLYTLWYQVPGFDNSANVDLIAIYLTGAATILLLAVPFIPGLRDIRDSSPSTVWCGATGTGEDPLPTGTSHRKRAAPVHPLGTVLFRTMVRATVTRSPAPLVPVEEQPEPGSAAAPIRQSGRGQAAGLAFLHGSRRRAGRMIRRAPHSPRLPNLLSSLRPLESYRSHSVGSGSSVASPRPFARLRRPPQRGCSTCATSDPDLDSSPFSGLR